MTAPLAALRPRAKFLARDPASTLAAVSWRSSTQGPRHSFVCGCGEACNTARPAPVLLGTPCGQRAVHTYILVPRVRAGRCPAEFVAPHGRRGLTEHYQNPREARAGPRPRPVLHTTLHGE